jgi:hypothetical protein
VAENETVAMENDQQSQSRGLELDDELSEADFEVVSGAAMDPCLNESSEAPPATWSTCKAGLIKRLGTK